MAPKIQIPVKDTLETLHKVLKKRSTANRVLKEAEKKKLSREEYQLMRVDLNNTTFLQPIDADNTKAGIHYARVKFIRFCDHMHEGQWDTAILGQNCDKGTMMSFLHWTCENYLAKKRKKGKRKSLNQYWRDFKMLYRRVNGLHVDANDSAEVIKYINGTLTSKFGLDNTSKPKPVAGSDDLLLLLVHHWARDKSVFPTEGDRHDQATIMLFQAYTGGRPAEFVHASKGKASQDPLGKAEDANKYRCTREALNEEFNDESDAGGSSEFIDEDLFDDEIDNDDQDDDGYQSDETDDSMTEDTHYHDTAVIDKSEVLLLQQDYENSKIDENGEATRKCKALCYEDICLWIVQNPKQGGRDLLAMEVHLRHHKGVDRKPKPTTFLFRENPRPILCPISHILARAICDDAILVDGYTSAEPFFETDLWGKGMKAMKVHWKLEWLTRPVFRRSIHVSGGWVKSMILPMTYSTYAFYLGRLGRDTGLEDKLISYCLRRGTANAIDGDAPDAVRDQVMRQDPFSGVFNGAYLNNCVRFNVQDAYLESDISDDGLTRAFTHMSIRCNPGAPKDTPDEVMEPLLAADPEIADLKCLVQDLHIKIKWEYKYIKHAPKQVKREYDDLQKQLKNARKSLKDEINDEYRKDYFYRIHNEMMKMQLKRPSNESAVVVEEEVEPVIEHQLIERTQLQQILCDFSQGLSSQDIVSRKVSAINLMIALASRQEFQTRKPRSATTHPKTLKQESHTATSTPTTQLDAFPLVCEKTQCIICIGNERLSYADRTRKFTRVSHMMDHVENVHLKHETANHSIICYHPMCMSQGLILNDVDHFKSHVATIHGITLRKSRYIDSR